MSDADYLNTAYIGEGIAICGIPPKIPLTTRRYLECFNCKRVTLHARKFSGSAWYEDDFICTQCGENENWGRPFRRGWREERKARARVWIANAVPAEEYRATVRRLIADEMGWDE